MTTGRVCIAVTELEERNVLSPWPLAPTNEPKPILATYGQWQELGTFGIHFHEGLDIRGTDKSGVYPVVPGVFTGLEPNAKQGGYNSFVVIETGKTGWNYIHTIPGNNKAGNPWKLGDTAEAGEVFGKLVALPGDESHSHVHLDRGDDIDPFMFSKGTTPDQKNIRRPTDDPLTVLDNLADTIKPTIETPEAKLHFRVADHELNMATRKPTLAWADGSPGDPNDGNQPSAFVGVRETERNDNHYFLTERAVDGASYRILGDRGPTSAKDGSALDTGVVKSRIDIIANATDKVGTGGNLDRVGVKTVGFSITGITNKAIQTGDVKSFDFTGEFVRGYPEPDPANPGKFIERRQDYGVLRMGLQTRVVYENDTFSDSKQGGNNWYIVTNTTSTGNVSVEVRDANRTRYWNSKVETGKDWNDITSVAGTNAKARFMDGKYTVDVWATDAKGNKSDPVNKKVIVDNFGQVIIPKSNGAGGVMIEKGYEFMPNSMVDIWVAPPVFPDEAFALEGFATKLPITAYTDANGEITNLDLGQLPASGVIVADYDQDGWFVPELDAVSPIQTSGEGASRTTRPGRFAGAFAADSAGPESPKPDAPTPGPGGAGAPKPDAPGSIRIVAFAPERTDPSAGTPADESRSAAPDRTDDGHPIAGEVATAGARPVEPATHRVTSLAQTPPAEGISLAEDGPGLDTIA